MLLEINLTIKHLDKAIEALHRTLIQCRNDNAYLCHVLEDVAKDLINARIKLSIAKNRILKSRSRVES